jgi:hypothetical protein
MSDEFQPLETGESLFLPQPFDPPVNTTATAAATGDQGQQITERPNAEPPAVRPAARRSTAPLEELRQRCARLRAANRCPGRCVITHPDLQRSW